MDDGEGWQERVRDTSADDATWLWAIMNFSAGTNYSENYDQILDCIKKTWHTPALLYIYIYIYIYIHIYIRAHTHTVRWEKYHDYKLLIRHMCFICFRFGGVRDVIVMAVGNEHGDTSSNPRRDWLHFT